MDKKYQIAIERHGKLDPRLDKSGNRVLLRRFDPEYPLDDYYAALCGDIWGDPIFRKP